LEINEVRLPFEGEETELGLRNFAIRAFQAETFLKTIKNEQVWKKVCVRHFWGKNLGLPIKQHLLDTYAGKQLP
jgi:hypothetical protein